MPTTRTTRRTRSTRSKRTTRNTRNTNHTRTKRYTRNATTNALPFAFAQNELRALPVLHAHAHYTRRFPHHTHYTLTAHSAKYARYTQEYRKCAYGRSHIHARRALRALRPHTRMPRAYMRMHCASSWVHTQAGLHAYPFRPIHATVRECNHPSLHILERRHTERL